jgi:hypothetical protein
MFTNFIQYPLVTAPMSTQYHLAQGQKVLASPEKSFLIFISCQYTERNFSLGLSKPSHTFQLVDQRVANNSEAFLRTLPLKCAEGQPFCSTFKKLKAKMKIFLKATESQFFNKPPEVLSYYILYPSKPRTAHLNLVRQSFKVVVSI